MDWWFNDIAPWHDAEPVKAFGSDDGFGTPVWAQVLWGKKSKTFRGLALHLGGYTGQRAGGSVPFWINDPA